jgi:hypothetical protein
MRSIRLLLALFSMLPILGLSTPPMAVQAVDPDWPCMQRKVPELSLRQVWNGKDLSPLAAQWSKDEEISALVRELASRRVPVGDAQQKIKQYASALAIADMKPRMEQLVLGLFEHINGERAQLMAGISRYAHKQVEMAAQVRKESIEVGALRNDPAAPAVEIDRRMQTLALQTRIFQERSQSLRYVCEVPAQFEQRLYMLLQTISKILSVK